VVGGEARVAKRDVATDVWRLMLDCALARFREGSGVLQQMGLTPGHVKLLMQLDEDEGHPMGSLAQAVGCDASTMTWLVDRLEERGLVQRRMLPSDRRVKAVALTPRGAQIKAKLAERLYDPPEELLAVEDDALAEVRSALARIREPDVAMSERSDDVSAGRAAQSVAGRA
jgi:DNA-binding MarR family transcriptional regulator